MACEIFKPPPDTWWLFVPLGLSVLPTTRYLGTAVVAGACVPISPSVLACLPSSPLHLFPRPIGMRVPLSLAPISVAFVVPAVFVDVITVVSVVALAVALAVALVPLVCGVRHDLTVIAMAKVCVSDLETDEEREVPYIRLKLR